jgi:hypothetical protein
MGIVYTPQPHRRLDVRERRSGVAKRVREIASTPECQILDPCTGTGNFIVNLMRRIPKDKLPQKYATICSPMNHAFALLRRVGQHRTRVFRHLRRRTAFEGLCFQTPRFGQSAQMGMFAEKNTERIAAEKGGYGDYRQSALQRRPEKRKRQQQKPRLQSAKIDPA